MIDFMLFLLFTCDVAPAIFLVLLITLTYT